MSIKYICKIWLRIDVMQFLVKEVINAPLYICLQWLMNT